MSEFEEHVKEEEELIFDGTEMPIQRPKDADLQKDAYSGKKKTHTGVVLVLSNKKRFILYVSKLYCGKRNDFGIFKEEFEPGLGWFVNYLLMVDLGFIGIAKLYVIKQLLIKYKKKRKTKNNPNPSLTEEQQQWNDYVSTERIYVEHAIGGMKIFRILINRCRSKCDDLKNLLIGNCAALWNYKLLFRANA